MLLLKLKGDYLSSPEIFKVNRRRYEERFTPSNSPLVLMCIKIPMTKCPEALNPIFILKPVSLVMDQAADDSVFCKTYDNGQFGFRPSTIENVQYEQFS
ncbi:hypothetical protein Ahia01_000132300 [Argonauta hians]